MKKFIFALFVSALHFLPSSAQTTQIATLSHEGTVSTFYSANALKDAYNAAADGDIITLSSGSFIGVDITKSITVRGAGMMPDDNPTIITGQHRLGASSASPTFTVEGLFFNELTYLSNCSDCRFIKCRFNEVYFNGTSSNFTILNCIMNPVTGVSNNATGNIINSFINIASSNSVYASIVLTNCHVYYCHARDGIQYQYNQTLRNCLIVGDNGVASNRAFPASTTVTHSYYVGASTGAFKNQTATSNVLTGKTTESELYGENDSNTPWTLKDELAKEWLGDDGTQVGMYGGIMPFDPTPTNPQITKFNVSSKTTADGKLSVDIEVKAN